MRKNTEKLAFSGVCIALSMVLGMVKLFSLPMGGSVTACSMLFATLPGFFFGTGYGLLSGFAYGLISFFLKPEFYSPAQFVVDYIFAFSALGISVLCGIPLPIISATSASKLQLPLPYCSYR